MKNVEKQEEIRKSVDLYHKMAPFKTCDIDIAHLQQLKRFSRNVLILRFLSMLCIALMLGLFLLQLDILWRTRESVLFEIMLQDSDQPFYFHYPEFYDIAHEEEVWCWDPDTLLLKVNTSFYVH